MAAFITTSCQPYLVFICSVSTKCPIILSFFLFNISYSLVHPGREVSVFISHMLRESIKSGHKISNGNSCGDGVMAEAPSLGCDLAH
jgi:hypothetical protein